MAVAYKRPEIAVDGKCSSRAEINGTLKRPSWMPLYGKYQRRRPADRLSAVNEPTDELAIAGAASTSTRVIARLSDWG
jgi:hypothetical protein